MTEADWLGATDPMRMLAYLDIRRGARPVPPLLASPRLRWLAVACCRRLWPLLPPGGRAAVEAVEEYARTRRPGLLTRAKRLHLVERRTTRGPDGDYPSQVREWAARVPARAAVETACMAAARQAAGAYRVAARAVSAMEEADRHVPGGSERTDFWQQVSSAELAAQSGFLRDIVGNPFRPVTFAPEWQTETVVALARAIDEARDFGPMPVLADSLEDAGCDQPDIIGHCRDRDAVHVRGCWVVDGVLGFV